LYFLLKEVLQDVSPLDEGNKLIFTTSILTGTPIPGSSRFTVAAKSPLTDGYGESEAGGLWGHDLKFAGYDILFVEGKSPEPVYININDNQVEIKSAAHLMGKETGEVEEILKKELEDPRTRILQIGPAGEKLVRYAAITNELRHWCGRTGLGAVMGSKKLRAIAVRGTGSISLKEEDKIKEYCKWFAKNVKKHPGFKRYIWNSVPAKKCYSFK
jgi:aldehyde:ferredoxin oxidoreductase